MQSSKPNNTISDLRDHLFATMEALRDKDNPLPLDRAEAIGKIGQTIINAAKVEVDLMRALDGKVDGSAFFNLSEQQPRLGSGRSATSARTPLKLGDRTVHRWVDEKCDECGAAQTDANEFARCPAAGKAAAASR